MIISPQGGQVFSEGGVVEHTWEWGGILEALDTPLEVRLNSAMRMVSTCQVDIRITLVTPKINATFQCGLQLKRTDTYLNRNKVEQITNGPMRGKYELNETVTQKRGKPIMFKGQPVTEILYQPPPPPSIVSLPKHLEPKKKELEGKDLSQNLQALDNVPLSVVANLIAADLADLKALAKKPTDKRPWSLGITLNKQKNKPLLRTKPSKRRPSSREAVDPLEHADAEAEQEKTKSLGAEYLPIPPVMKLASGAYRHREGGPTKRVSLKCINPPQVIYQKDKYGTPHPHLAHFDKNKRKCQFFDFVRDVTYKDKLLTVACLQQDSQRCRQTRCMCEDANGLLHREKRWKEHVLVEYNMTDSRFLLDHYRIRSVPMFLCFYNGRLVTATTTLNKGAAPTSLKDFLAQIETSLSDARSNRFLPEDFTFDPGHDNALTMNFMDAKDKIRSDFVARNRADYEKVQKALAARNAETYS